MPVLDVTVLARPRRLAAARRARRLLPGLAMPLDAIAALAARLTGADIAIVAVMEVDQEHFVGSHGLPEPLASGQPVSVAYSVCKYVVSADHPVAVGDMTADADLRDHALVVEFGARAFAGVPIRDAADQTVGSLVVVDTVARDFTEAQVALLVEVATLLAGLPASDPESEESGTAAVDPLDHGGGAQRGFLRALLDSLSAPVAAVDADGRLRAANRAMFDLHALPASATTQAFAVAATAHLRRPDGTPLPWEHAPLLRAIRGERIRDEELLVTVPGAPARTVLANAQPVLSSDAEPLGAVLACHDITDRRRVERFRVCQQAVATALAETGDVRRGADRIAAAVATALGWPHVELWVHDAVNDVLRLAGHRSTVAHDLADVLARDVSRGEGVTGIVWATGEPLWVPDLAETAHVDSPGGGPRVRMCIDAGLRTILSVPIPDGGGNTVGVLTCFADNAELDRTALTTLLTGIAEQLGQFIAARHNEQLTVELARRKDDFLSLVGHEMRTPLTAISAYIDILIDDPAPPARPEETRGLLEGIARNTGALTTIIDDLLDLAGLESGHLRIATRPVDLAAIARHALHHARDFATANSVTLTDHLPEDLVTTGDPMRLRQVLDNLLSNAVKYSPDGGRAHLVVTAQDQVVTISVTDTGIGIPAADQGRLFDRFYRAANTRHSGLPGTGLGLSVVRAIVGAHHGDIAVDSSHPHGTTVTVRLPHRPPASARDTPGVR